MKVGSNRYMLLKALTVLHKTFPKKMTQWNPFTTTLMIFCTSRECTMQVSLSPYLQHILTHQQTNYFRLVHQVQQSRSTKMSSSTYPSASSTTNICCTIEHCIWYFCYFNQPYVKCKVQTTKENIAFGRASL